MLQRRSTRARALVAPALLLAAGLGIAACSSSSNDSTTAGSSTTAAKSTGSTPGTTAGGEAPAEALNLPQVLIKVTEEGGTYLFDAPESVESGWVEVTLQNNGKLSHQAGVGHLAEGKTFDELQTAIKTGGAMAALPLLAFDGGPNSVSGGETQKTIIWLEPGEHVLYCMVPDVTDGKPHVEHGMVTKLTVTAPKSGTTSTTKAGGTTGTTVNPAANATPPVKAVGTITMKDYGYDQPEDMKPGWYEIVNDGPQPHELTIIELNDGATADEAKAYLEAAETAPPTGPPPFTDAGGFGAIADGGIGYVYLDLDAGNYVAMCFVPDVPAEGRTGTPDLKPHYAHGMWQPFTVK